MISHDLIATLERLRTTVGLSESSWLNILGIRSENYRKILAHEKPLSFSALLNVVEYLNLDLERLIDEGIDYTVLARHHSGNLAHIPERYAVGAFSKLSVLANYVHYLHFFHGREFSLRVLRHFQIHEVALRSPSRAVNIHFFQDLAGYLRKAGFSEAQFQAVGLHNRVTHQNSPFASELRKLSTPKQLYETGLGELIHFYERNYSYRFLKLTDDRGVVESRARQEVLSVLKVKKLGSSDTCAYRRGAIGAMAALAAFPAADVTESRCVHRGDSMCRFEVDFSAAASAKLSRRLLESQTH